MRPCKIWNIILITLNRQKVTLIQGGLSTCLVLAMAWFHSNVDKKRFERE